MGFTNFGGKFCRRVEIEQGKNFFNTIFDDIKEASIREINDIINQNSNILISELSYCFNKNKTDILEMGFKINNDSNLDFISFRVPIDYSLLYCNGMIYNSRINIEKNLYAPKILNYTRVIAYPGFHKTHHNQLIIEKFMNQNWSIKINEFISSSFFFDKDELKRLHDFDVKFDYPIDIERPANVSKHHFAYYSFPINEFNGTTLTINMTLEGNWEMRWLVPFHLRYQLPDKKNPDVDVNREFSYFLARMPELFYSCNDDVIPRQTRITDFEELIANEINITNERWTRLHYYDNTKDKHIKVEVPVVPLRGKYMLFGYLPVNFEYFSIWVVLSSMILIGVTSVIKTSS